MKHAIISFCLDDRMENNIEMSKLSSTESPCKFIGMGSFFEVG